MKKVLLFLVFLVFFNSIDSAEQLQALINQEPHVDFSDYADWRYELFSECWFNIKTGEVSVADPRNNTLNAPKASTR